MTTNHLQPREEIRKLYETYYQKSPRERDWYRVNCDDKADNVMHFCKSFAHDKIIDIGSGPGEVIRELSRRKFGSSFVAADVGESGLAPLRADPFPGLNGIVDFDGITLPFKDQEFDLAILAHVIEHLDHPRIALAEAARVAKYVYVEVPLEFNMKNRRFSDTSKPFDLGSTGHVNFFNPKLARTLVKSSGYDLLASGVRHFRREVYTFHRPGLSGMTRFWIKETIHRLAPEFSTNFLNFHFGMVYTKYPSASNKTA